MADDRSSAFVVVLTGAGISAESGIPTFRGAEGYWQVGSRNYRPMELATAAAFARMPDDVWGWYLYRRAVCHAAAPNQAHLALAELERRLGDRFLLVTQNVDGLHLRAGSSAHRTYQIHGNIDYMRCARECTLALVPVPDALGTTWDKGRIPGAAEKAHLVCSRCGAPSRPHVLWFDEYYDEERFRFESSLRAVDRAAVLAVIGTSGATNLPTQMCHRAAQRGAKLIVVDTEPTSFSALAESGSGEFLRGAATEIVPALCGRL
ncbi:MAG TPA: Sir2 family NAD-dependent protein deacetylase [Polyangiaceae bacterium]|nr:Sir2 family NAD-dependent protein deacetylase [Polyangiaceae bacterium]